jgi:hypothetical protein
MNVCIQVASPGLYQYTFTLTLDNHDNSWTPGYGIGWIVFGDVPSGQSPINDFIGDPASLPIGPWTGYSSSGGSHNGPNLSPVVEQQPPFPNIYWIPNAVGDSLTWRGTSAHLVTQLQWSNLFITGGADFIAFEDMTSTGCGPSGACCTTSGCQILSSELCSAVGGVYNGDGTPCSICPAIGACCSDAGCTIMTQAACASSNGRYQGDTTTCPTANYLMSSSNAQFVDISTTGTLEPITSGCDDCTAIVSLPFPFTFYGNSYDSVYICSNGNLQFGAAPDAQYNNDTIPSAAVPNNAIYPCWDDLYPFGQGDIYYQTDGTAPTRTFTVAWVDCAQFTTGPALTFECILYEGSNNIEFRYGDIPSDTGGGGPGASDYTIGVENATGAVATIIQASDIGTGHTARLLTYVPASCGPVCGSADFDCDGDTATDADIEAFFRCVAGNCPALPCTSIADFDGDGDSATDADIEAFFRVLAGGHC